jgi:hypothetical protein
MVKMQERIRLIFSKQETSSEIKISKQKHHQKVIMNK